MYLVVVTGLVNGTYTSGVEKSVRNASPCMIFYRCMCEYVDVFASIDR